MIDNLASLARLWRGAFAGAILTFLVACPHPNKIPLFNGVNLDGWLIGDSNSHGNTAAWTVEDGVIVGMQDVPGNGGMLITERLYGDFFVELEVRPDFGMDSGLFLRSTAGGNAYQVTIDYIENRTVGSLFGERLGTGFFFLHEDWEALYDPTDWNKIAASIEGNPPLIKVWLNDQHVVTFQDDEERLPDTGHIALQIHGGERFAGFEMRARRIFIKELKPQRAAN